MPDHLRVNRKRRDSQTDEDEEIGAAERRGAADYRRGSSLGYDRSTRSSLLRCLFVFRRHLIAAGFMVSTLSMHVYNAGTYSSDQAL